MKHCYRSKAFGAERLATIENANNIIAEYQTAGIMLTLRQLYYQFVSRNLIPNTERSYKNLGTAINEGRLAGLIDWGAVTDRTRQPVVPSEWRDIEELVRSAVHAYRLPRWEGQDHYVELWVEKDALASVLAPLAHEYHVVLMVNRGYSSQSAMYEAGNRIARWDMRQCTVLYVGDHDPSGEDMVRDVQDRLEMFGADVQVRKLALNMDQVEEYNPPPNPAKMSDSRAAAYVAKHGDESWEVDALRPEVLTQIIRDAVEELLDQDLMDKVIAREDKDKLALAKAAKRINKD